MDYYNTIYDVIRGDEVLDIGMFKMVLGYDEQEMVKCLWLTRPGESIKKGYRVYGAVRITGLAIASIDKDYAPEYMHDYPYAHLEMLPFEERQAAFFENLNLMVDEACNNMIVTALPYIEDGCVLIANHYDGPWTNLMPE